MTQKWHVILIKTTGNKQISTDKVAREVHWAATALTCHGVGVCFGPTLKPSWVYLTVSDEGETFTWINTANGILNEPEHTKSMWKNPASAPSFGAEADLTSAQTTAQPDLPPVHESFMRRVETIGTLYGLIQTWPASPQTPQVGNLVPRHIGFDVTTLSGSIFFFWGQPSCLAPGKHFAHFTLDTGEDFSPREDRD